MTKENTKNLILGILISELKNDVCINRLTDLADNITNAIDDPTIPPLVQRCDKCGCIPIILHVTDSGRLCEQCYRATIPLFNLFTNAQWSQK